MRGVMVILLALMLTGQAWAAIDTWQFKDEAQEQAFREITSQLRCPKCQNNSIADSNAMIAADMRQKVYELMQQGKTKGQIVDYMVARYGNFVSYEPPLTAGTVLLWLGPGLFVLAFIPQFVNASRGPVALQMLAYGAIFAVLTTLTFTLLGSFAAQLSAWLQRRPRAVAGLTTGAGLTFIAAGLSILALPGRAR